VNVRLVTTSKCKEISKEARDIGYLGKQDVLLCTTLIDLNYHLPLGDDLMRGGACKDNVSRLSFSSFYLIEVGRVVDMNVRTRVNNLSIEKTIAS
jgi:hypothetical protein